MTKQEIFELETGIAKNDTYPSKIIINLYHKENKTVILHDFEVVMEIVTYLFMNIGRFGLANVAYENVLTNEYVDKVTNFIIKNDKLFDKLANVLKIIYAFKNKSQNAYRIELYKLIDAAFFDDKIMKLILKKPADFIYNSITEYLRYVTISCDQYTKLVDIIDKDIPINELYERAVKLFNDEKRFI